MTITLSKVRGRNKKRQCLRVQSEKKKRNSHTVWQRRLGSAFGPEKHFAPVSTQHVVVTYQPNEGSLCVIGNNRQRVKINNFKQFQHLVKRIFLVNHWNILHHNVLCNERPLNDRLCEYRSAVLKADHTQQPLVRIENGKNILLVFLEERENGANGGGPRDGYCVAPD